MDIEEVAANSPGKIKNFPINIKDGITNEYISKLIRFLGISNS
jgi:succinyl-CoA synthetase beta subunit